MANFDHQDQAGTERPRQSFQQLPQRSLASTNWRMKDDSPRADPQPRQNRQNQYQGQNRSYDSPGRSQNSQLREAPGTRLYVGNLLYSATRNDVEQFFTANGFNVSGISMSVDPATGRNPSYCFVDFETPEDATKAMADLNGVELLGRGVRINVGVARQGNSATPQGKSGYGNQGGTSRGWGQDSATSPVNRWNRNENSTSYSPSTTTQDNQAPTKRLYVGNLPLISPQSSIEEAIQSLFAPLGIEVTNISKLISPHESKKDLPGDHHYLFVDLARAEDAEFAIESLDGPGKVEADWIGSEGLKVNKARENDRRRQQLDRSWQSRDGGYQGRRSDSFKDWRRSEKQTE